MHENRRFDFWIELDEQKPDGAMERLHVSEHVSAPSSGEAQQIARQKVKARYPNAAIVSITDQDG